MKFFRILSKLLLLLLILAAVFVAVAFIPDVQTWLARQAIARHPDLHLSVGALSAGFGKVEVEDLRLELNGAVLTVPTLEAGLPLMGVARNKKIALQRLIAKGWTLDLGRTTEQPDLSAQNTSPSESPGPPQPAAEAISSPAQQAIYLFSGLLSRWKFPCGVSAEGIDLEGDVLIPLSTGKERARVHVTISGGGIAVGHAGELAIDAKAIFLGSQIIDLAAHGRLMVSMDTPQTINRLELKAALSAKSDSPPDGLTLSADLVAARVPGEETYSVDLSRGDRHLVILLAHFPETKRQLVGTWKIDLQNSDLGPFVAEHSWPDGAATGEGEFDADATFARIQILGRVAGTSSHWGILAPPLERMGSITLDTRFDAVREGHSIKVNHLSVALEGPRPVAIVQSLQPFEVDFTTGAVTLEKPLGDWMEGSIKGLPLNWLSGLTGNLGFTGGDLTGEFLVQSSNGGYVLRPKSPFTAMTVSVQRAGNTIARDLDLSVSLLADKSTQAWQVQCAPLTVSSAGRRVATFDAKASQSAGPNNPIIVAGKLNADLAALSSQPGMAGLNEIAAHSASGDFSATFGVRTKMEGNLVIIQQDAEHSIAVKLNGEVGKEHTITFHAPIKIAAGPKLLELATEGTWAAVKGAHSINLRLVGKEVDFEDLGLLAPLFGVTTDRSSAADKVNPIHAMNTAVAQRDQSPFWGDTIGRIYLAFDRLKTGSSALEEVRAMLKIEPRSIRLANAQYQLSERHLLGAAEGSISFDPAAESPYHLEMKLDDGEIDGALLFEAPPAGQDPAFHGRFSSATSLTGAGANLNDLIGHSEQVFRLKSTGGIVRLLKTRLIGLTQDKESTVGNVADTVGTLFGKLAGLNKNAIGGGRIQLSKSAEAVLNFSYQAAEIGYNEITFVAKRGIDGTLHLTELAMVTPDEHVTGKGEITYVKGVSLVAAPLSVELTFGVRDQTAELLAKTGLLSTEKDNLGYTLFKQPVHFGGTLQRLDLSQWHDLLFEAATQKSPPETAKAAKP